MKQLILAGAFFASAACMAQGPYKIGDAVADFSLKNTDGKTVSMGGLPEAKGFILVFTCNHCPFSQAYEQRILDLDKKYDPKGYPVIAINPNDPNREPGDSFDEMVKRAAANGYTFPYLVDETQETARMFGASRTPHVFIVKRENGNLVLKYIGAIDNNTEDGSKADKKYVEDAVNALLKNHEPPVTETKAIGCGIKWKQ